MKYVVPISVWAGLGFGRGVNSYNYSHKGPYLYSSSFMYGVLGLVIYVNPAFLPLTTYKELYRLEINIRDINEKNDKYYNELF